MQDRNKLKVVKQRTTISITPATHAIGLKLAALERRDFSAMVANAIDERWEQRDAPVPERARSGGRRLKVLAG